MAIVNTFAGSRIDRAGDLRSDPSWLAEQAADPEAVAVILWEGQPLLGDDARLVRLSIDQARDLIPDREIFLGLDGGRPVFAMEFEGSGDPSEGPARGLGAFHEMRGAAALLPGDEAAMVGAAKSLFDWRRRHGFCASCGRATRDACGGWKRICEVCGVEHFPRVDPVTIMLVTHKDRCLLGRQASWPEGRMSALAGFLEPGESIEEACAREVKEEAGLTVTAVRYHSSQPWPFPSQLMIGLFAEASSDDARPDQTELEAVAWLTREEARACLAGDHAIKPPPPIAIARTLIQAFTDGW